MENSIVFPQKLKTELLYGPEIPLSVFIQNNKWKHDLKEMIRKSQDMETT